MTPREKWLVGGGVLSSVLLSLAAWFPFLQQPASRFDEAVKTEAARVPRCTLDAGLERCTSFAGSAYELNDRGPGAPCTCPER